MHDKTAERPGPVPEEVQGIVEETSAVYLGKWNRLVSTTNWEKGRIICQWRQHLSAAGAPAAAYTDEAWSRCVGRVSPQHVGRLRRVFERFGQGVEQYPGLYWSHFQAALDWDDAEMWLEGAVQNQWSIEDMRRERSETLGAVAAEATPGEDLAADEYDEDAPADAQAAQLVDHQPVDVQGPGAAVQRESEHLADDRDEPEQFADDDADEPQDHEPVAAVEPVRPFENLTELPDDVSEAFERFKLVLLGHKLAGWKELSCQQALGILDGLKQMLLAPSDAPF